MNIGLYFGSFNPIHVGHLIIANHIIEHSDLDKIWFVVSPHNPLKPASSLLNEYNRLHLVELAIQDNPKFRASNIEFNLPKPSYTIDTLTYLQEKFPLEKFSVIMGSDSYQNLPRWKNYEQLLKQYRILVYERPQYPVSNKLSEQTVVLQAPMLDISSTFIRQQIKENKSIKYLVKDEVIAYIKDSRYYL
ncbi:nicotinic acid mononucleotide adenylyltransferase [Taibaiella sp. KBW10]|uniref:nicotinate (nicotinamide) nucleotide adenylyltransferase n=1 Tax=Taibaiella sp. KBW10 TaxID=2153357 RepID=UPI000F59A3E6|nr:nicotinate (nicotinamide) nucleotide adenylyltransferase [Taibaiella sp. KBW10]RQO30626.1 nicotinic acid mononucleotide adenylyltransferase [Taibaiella sp. KBW10]